MIEYGVPPEEGEDDKEQQCNSTAGKTEVLTGEALTNACT